MNEFRDRGNNTTSFIAWTGHIVSGFHGGDNARSTSWAPHNTNEDIHVIVMTVSNIVNENDNYIINRAEWWIRWWFTRLLLHETAHQIGANDHYCNEIDAGNASCDLPDCWRCMREENEPDICVMSWEMGDIFCARCAGIDGTINIHLENHHRRNGS
jgi:hypothetical protein